jgi:DNA-binding helix-hairpin-helix protein with protein kinase domain
MKKKKQRHYRTDKLTYEELYDEIQKMAKEMPRPATNEVRAKSRKDRFESIKRVGKKAGKAAIKGAKKGANLVKVQAKNVRHYPDRLDDQVQNELEEIEQEYGPRYPKYVPPEESEYYERRSSKKRGRKKLTRSERIDKIYTRELNKLNIPKNDLLHSVARRRLWKMCEKKADKQLMKKLKKGRKK